MSKLQIYSLKGTKSGTMELPKAMVIEPNMNLLTQANHVYESRFHKGTSKVKTRSEVQATGAKMYRQKGTGRARHGDAKAPIFVGGGIAHGPHGINRTVDLPKGLGKRAFLQALNLKIKAGRVALTEKLSSVSKTKEAQKLLTAVNTDFGIKKPVSTLVVMADDNRKVVQNFRNIEGVYVKSWRNLNSYDVYLAGLLVIDKDAFDYDKSSKPAGKTAKESVRLESATTKPQNAKSTPKVRATVKKTTVKKVKSVKTKAKAVKRSTKKK